MQKKDGNVIKSLIDRLHKYFGIALRSNAKPELKPELKQVLLASIFHVASSQGENYHTHILPPKLLIAGASITDYINQNLYKPGPGIANVIKEIKTIYQDLTKDNDLVPAWHYTKRE